MLNLKLALSALAMEFAAWGSLWMMRSHSDSALLSYLLMHALACALLALCLLPFLPAGTQKRQRWLMAALIAVLCYGVPIAGFIGAVVATLALRRHHLPVGGQRFASLALPAFDEHQHAGSSRRQTGLQSFLTNPSVPVPSRMRAMVALGNISGHVASPMLRTALTDANDDLRLLAYSMLDRKERQISQAIHQERQALLQEQATLSYAQPALSPRGLQAAWALADLYWEMIYQGVAQGDVREHAIEQSLLYCAMVLKQRPNHALMVLRRGRLLHAQQDLEQAAQCYERALALGLSPTRVVPYQAQLMFEQGRFGATRQLMRSLGPQQALPRLRPCVMYWSAP